jgi:predicted ATP-dependent endonuclease of OLD family
MVMEGLASLNVALYYLSDNRRSEQDAKTLHEIDLDLADYDVVFTHEAGEVVPHRRRRQRKHILETAISDLEDLLRHEAIGAANVGEANINSIYLDIAKRVIRAKGQQVAASQAQVRELVNTLQYLMEESRPFSELGLLPDLDLTELIELTNQAKTTTKRTLATVLQPYVESVTARLNALRPTQQLIDTLVGTLNRFYTQKRVRFDLRRGLRILQHRNTVLPPQALSSGEQQLLLLFCNTIRARSQATIFIIDEPELSLNVKWQRRLLEALLGLVSGTQVQFAIATHSVELLATHKSAVVRLLTGEHDLSS